MSLTGEKIRALSLFSGGLDSQLAVCLLKEQGVHVEVVTFESPFFDAGNARKAADALCITIHVVDFTAEIMELLVNPRHGFGSEMNPCIDCHALMIRRAGELMKEMGFHFLSTGEVLNQRPMSQNRQSLAVVTDESGCGRFLLRPMSARLLPETEPERQGWVDRSRLLAIEGRNRKAQIKLAKRYGLTNIPQPAGGCKLTEPNFCKRLRDLQGHEGLEVRAVRLLRIGRHFRLGDRTRAIVGRDESENNLLENLVEQGETLIRPEVLPGPTVVISRSADELQIMISAAICARYCDLESENPVSLRMISAGSEKVVMVNPAARSDIERRRI